MAGRHAPTIDLRSRALPVIDIHLGTPTDGHIHVHDNALWVVECLSCWGDGDEAQYLGSFASERMAIRRGAVHVHDGRLGAGA